MLEYIDYFHLIPTTVYKDDQMMFLLICFNIINRYILLSSYELLLIPLTNPSNENCR